MGVEAKPYVPRTRRFLEETAATAAVSLKTKAAKIERQRLCNMFSFRIIRCSTIMLIPSNESSSICGSKNQVVSDLGVCNLEFQWDLPRHSVSPWQSCDQGSNMEIPFVTVPKQKFLLKPYGHLRAVHLVVTFQTQPFSTSMPMGERVNVLGVYWEFCLFQSLYLIFKSVFSLPSLSPLEVNEQAGKLTTPDEFESTNI